MTPGNPARVEIVKWTDELPPDDRQRAIVTRVAAALGSGRDAGAATADLFAEGPVRDRLTRRLAHLAIDYGACDVQGGGVRTVHEPFGDDSPRVTFHLRCAGGPLDLDVTLDEKTGRLVELAGHPPRAPDATCWQ